MTDPRLARLQQIQALWQQYPGRAPNGSGLTGLQSSDGRGWSSMLNEQTEGLRLAAELQGKQGPNIEYGGDLDEPFARANAMAPTYDPRFQTSAVSTAAPTVNKEGQHTGFDMYQRGPQRKKLGHQNPALNGLLGAWNGEQR